MESNKKLIAILVLSLSLAISLGAASAQTSGGGDITTEPAPGAAPAKFDAGFYQKIQDLIESDRTGPRGTSDTHDGQPYYNVIIVVGRDGDNPDGAAGDNKDSIVRHLESLGARDIAAGRHLSFVTVSVPVAEIPALSLRAEIRQMGDGELPMTPQVDTARHTIRATPYDLRQAVGWAPNGTGVTVAVVDTGINSTHLNDRVAHRALCGISCGEQPAGIIEGTYRDWVRITPHYYELVTYHGPIYASHGTQVAGVLAASGMRSHNGIAPGVTLLDALYRTSSATWVHALDWSYGKGADVANLSVADPDCGSANSVTMIVNEVVDRGMVLVSAAGNTGYKNLRPVYQSMYHNACAHNTIAVGGINDRGSEIEMYRESSRGPTSDSELRLVPHIVAPAANIQALVNTVNDTTSRSDGTSLAAPQVSAAAAILLQVSPELDPAGVRAALLLGADWTGPIPCTSAQYEQNNADDPCSYAMQPADRETANNASSLKILNNVGFGILNVAGSLGYANSSSPHIISDYLDATTGIRTYEFNVTDASEPVKVILTWMVPEQILTDLNLEITTPGGSIIDASSVHQTTEFAVFNPPETGTYTIKVQGAGSGSSSGHVQTFALASSSSFPVLAIDAVDGQTVNVHSTLRLNVTVQNATGPVRYSINPLEGAYIHPLSGHLVYVPVAGQQGLQNITVKVANSYDTDSITIPVAVGEPAATVTGIEVLPDGTHVATVDVGPDDVTGMFAARTHADTAALSDPATSDAGTNAARFASDILGSDHPKDDTIYYFAVWPGSSPDPDDRIYARFAPGQNGSEKIIPNPLSRPAHYVQNISTAIQTGRSVTVQPELADSDGNPTRITAVTNGTEGTARTNGTAVTYTLNAGAVGADAITYTVTDNTGLEVDGTINITFEPFAIDIVDDRTVAVHSTLRLDILAQNAKGPVTWSIDEKSGARIHPATGHLVYLPPPGSEGPQTLTVRADDGISSASADISVNVTGPAGTVTDLKLYTNNKFRFGGIYTSNNPTPDALRFGGLSGDTFAGIGGAFNRADNIPRHFRSGEFPAPEPYTLYLLIIRPDTSGSNSADSNIFVRTVPGHAGFPIVPIPNPFTRPDPFAPDITVPAGTVGMPVPITPDLTGMDGGQVNITDVTYGITGRTTHTDTTITYRSNTGPARNDTVTYTVTDDAGRTGTGTITIIGTNSEPLSEIALQTPVPQTADEGATMDYDIPVSNADGQNIAWGITSESLGATITEDGVFVWTPGEEHGGRTHEFDFAAAAATNTVSGTLSVGVTETNEDPVFATIKTRLAGSVGVQFTHDLNASDADTPEQTISYRIVSQSPSENPAQIDGQTGLITWTPETVETRTITVEASDDHAPNGTARITLAVSVQLEPILPLTVVPDRQVAVSGTLRINITAQNGSGDVRYGVDPLEGARIHPVTGHLVYLPPPGSEGPQTITVRADNGSSSAWMEIGINVTGPIGAITSVELPYGRFHHGTYDSNNPTPDYVHYGVFSGGAAAYESRYTKLAVNVNRLFTVTFLPPQPEPHTLYFVGIQSELDSGEADSNMYARLVPGQAGFTIIQNPHTRPDPFAPDITVYANVTDMPVSIRPELVGMDGGPVNITTVTNGTRGKAVHSDTAITYTPDAAVAVTDTINYTVTDDRGVNSTAMATIILTNIPLAARNDNATTYENVTVSIPVLDNDDGNDATVTVPEQPDHGTAEPETDGTITYTPEPGHNGQVTFMYVISRDGENQTAAVTVTIHEPVAFEVPQNPPGAKSITIPELEPYAFNITITNTDNVDHTISLDPGEPPATGAAITQTGSFTWRPTEAQGPGMYQIAIIIDPEPKGAANVTEQITLHVTEANQNPVFEAVNASRRAVVGEPFMLDLNASDGDIPEQAITYAILSQNPPANPAVINGTTGLITWTPATAGTRSITVQAGDDHAPNGTASLTVAITVTDAPSANTTTTTTTPANMTKPVNMTTPANTTTPAPTPPTTPPPSNAPQAPRDDGTAMMAPVSNGTVTGILEAYMSRGLVAFSGHPAPGLDTARGSTSAGFLIAGILVNGTYAGMPGAWTASDDITVFVNEAGNVPPVLSEIGDYTINAQSTLTFTTSATDFNGTASYRLSGAPAGAEISGQGEFSWMPGSADVGGHTFMITAYDRHNATDTESVAVTVLTAGTPNRSPNAPDVAATVPLDGRIVIIPAISDPDDDPVRITGAAGDAGGLVTFRSDQIEYVAGQNPGIEAVIYNIADGRGGVDTGTIMITIR